LYNYKTTITTTGELMNLDKQMHDAAKQGDIATLETLLANGADIDGGRHETPLSMAAFHNQMETVQYLLRKGADIHSHYGHALISAAAAGNLDIVKFLLSKGADIHERNDLALANAANMGRLETVKFLLDYGADIHAGDEQALDYAASGHQRKVAMYLLSRNADIDVAIRKMAVKNNWSLASFLINQCNAVLSVETCQHLRDKHRDFYKIIMKKSIIRKYVPRAQSRKEEKPSYRQSQK
jgi:hypothetical protein